MCAHVPVGDQETQHRTSERKSHDQFREEGRRQARAPTAQARGAAAASISTRCARWAPRISTPPSAPRRQTLELTIPCTTPNIVESKSLKLYLNSLNFKRFASPAAVVETIAVDVGRVLGAPLRVALRDDMVEPPLLDAWRGPRPGAGLGLSWACIDDEDVGDLPAEHLDKPDPTHLRPVAFATGSGAVVVERIVTHLLRTRCPVTGQPDWGSLLVEYQGAAPVDRGALLRYIVSLRREIGFHENAVERIALAIAERCAPSALRVTGRFFRRGGIDINPTRSSLGADAALGAAPPQLRVPGQ